jgi:glc operon protein GlcG
MAMIEMTVEIAQRAVAAALGKAAQLGTPMTVSVVDEGGRLVMTVRGDGAGFLTPETSRAKAVAAAAFRRPTREMVELHAKRPAFWGSLPTVVAGQALPSTGGVPIVRQGRVIGAVGCGGGTGEQDHECAAAGAEAAGDRLPRQDADAP